MRPHIGGMICRLGWWSQDRHCETESRTTSNHVNPSLQQFIKLSTMDENHLSGLSIPDLHVDYVWHACCNDSVGAECTLPQHGSCVPCSNEIVRVKCTWLQHGLRVPCSKRCVRVEYTRCTHGIWLPCAQNWIGHWKCSYLPGTMFTLWSSPLPKGLPSLNKSPYPYSCCKHDIQLAYMSSLVLLLEGDVELNPGPHQNVVNDTSKLLGNVILTSNLAVRIV